MKSISRHGAVWSIVVVLAFSSAAALLVCDCSSGNSAAGSGDLVSVSGAPPKACLWSGHCTTDDDCCFPLGCMFGACGASF